MLLPLLMNLGMLGDGSTPPVVVDDDVLPGGTSKGRKRAKKPRIRFSDFESRDAYQAALQAILNPPQPAVIATATEEDDDDEVILLALTKVIH